MEPYFEYHYHGSELILQGIRDLDSKNLIKLDSPPGLTNHIIKLNLIGSEMKLIQKHLGILPFEIGPDINKLIDERIAFVPENVHHAKIKKGFFDFLSSRTKYPTFQGVLTELKALEESPIVTLDHLPGATSGFQSIPSVRIPILKIGKKENLANGPSLIIVCGVHSDEYLPIVLALELCHSLVEHYNNMAQNPLSKSVKEFLERGTIQVVPILNPDGYRYNLSRNRKWRKNRRRIQLPGCKTNTLGVNLNRNYPVHFGWKKGHTNPNTAEYQGIHPLSEKETLSLSTHLRQNPQIRSLIDFHTNDGQLIYRPRHGFRIRPFGHASRTVNTVSEPLLDKFEKAFQNGSSGGGATIFNSGGQGPNCGTLDDYAFFAHGLNAMTVECGSHSYPDLREEGTQTTILNAIKGVITCLKTI